MSTCIDGACPLLFPVISALPLSLPLLSGILCPPPSAQTGSTGQCM